jgi:phage terminase large subunit-like protein
MTTDLTRLIETWREMGPTSWAQSPYGWIDLTGQPVTLTPWQSAALRAWEAHSEAVSTLCVSNIKKTGKTFLNAMLLCWRWLALPGEHLAVGNDFDQSAGRQFSEISDMVRRNPYLKSTVKVLQRGLVFTPTGSTIKALAVDAAGNAGSNHLTASHTEAWGIVYEAGIRAYEELTNPPGKFYGYPALRVVDSYAGFEGQSNTWHKLVDKGLAGERIDSDWPIYLNGGLMLFHVTGEEAQQRCFRGTPSEADTYYGDQRSQLRESAFRRMHANERTGSEEQFVDKEDFDACVSFDVHRNSATPGSVLLFGGVDAGVKHDTSAAVLVYFDKTTGQITLHDHMIWTPRGGKPLDLQATIGDYLLTQRAQHSFGCVYFDPYQLNWLNSGGYRVLRPAEFPQTPNNQTIMTSGLFSVLVERRLQLYPCPDLREHVLNAVAIEGPRGVRLAKERTSRKIDGSVALALAITACLEHDRGLRLQQRAAAEIAMNGPAAGPIGVEAARMSLKVRDRYVNGSIGVSYQAGQTISVSESVGAYLLRDAPENFTEA